MFCTNCGKELKDGAVVCMNCGVLVKTNDGKPVTLQNGTFTVASADVVTKKKKPKVIIIAIVIAVLLIFGIIRSAFGSSDDEVIKSNSPTGASFNCTIDEFVNNYNNYICSWVADKEKREQLELKENELVELSEDCYIWSNPSTFEQLSKIYVNTDDDENIYQITVSFSEFIQDDDLPTVVLNIMTVILGLQPSKEEEQARKIVQSTCILNEEKNKSLQQDNVFYDIVVEETSAKFSIMANFD